MERQTQKQLLLRQHLTVLLFPLEQCQQRTFVNNIDVDQVSGLHVKLIILLRFEVVQRTERLDLGHGCVLSKAKRQAKEDCGEPKTRGVSV